MICNNTFIVDGSSSDVTDTPTTRVLLGMSGGVDSTVAALLLMQSGYEVMGCTCLFCGDDDANNSAVQRACAACQNLGIEHIVYDARKDFANKIIHPFCESYVSGTTPSPCVMCNQFVKLPALARVADESNCRYIATGHYALVASNGSGIARRFYVGAHPNKTKDQSYMLSRVSQDILSRLLLPLSDVGNKDDVREIARQYAMPSANTDDSQDICFAPNGYKRLLEDLGYDLTSYGDIVDTSGNVLGKHAGLTNYTIGQRRGIGVACSQGALYVIAKDRENNELVVGQKDELMCDSFVISDMVFQKAVSIEDLTKQKIHCVTRYHGQPVACTVSHIENNKYLVSVTDKIIIPASGQYAVFYDGTDIVCCGLIQNGHD